MGHDPSYDVAPFAVTRGVGLARILNGVRYAYLCSEETGGSAQCAAFDNCILTEFFADAVGCFLGLCAFACVGVQHVWRF